jgi:hypothetical protein
MDHTTAADTPNALDSIGAANTRTDTTKPIMQARRPNSVSSPPHNIAPPAIAIPIRPMAYATGPVRDVAIAVIGRSQGERAGRRVRIHGEAYAIAKSVAARSPMLQSAGPRIQPTFFIFTGKTSICLFQTYST